MDAVIRSAQLAPARTRLSEASTIRSPGAPTTPKSARSELETLRGEIEKQLRAEYSQEMQELYAEERERGRVDGLATAMTEARAAVTEELKHARKDMEARLDSALSALTEAHQSAWSKLESSVGEVAFAAVCRVVSQLATSQEFVLGLVEHTCAQLRADAMATARLHPRDIEILRELLNGNELRVQALGLKVIPDESLALGGCVIEAASGHYDGGLESQLRRLHTVLCGEVAAGV